MTTFLFWNLNKKSLEGLVADLAVLNEVDVLILTECEIPTHVMLETLNHGEMPMFHHVHVECDEIVIYTRFPSEFLQKKFDSSRLTIRRLKLPGRQDILLAATHLVSKRNWSDASQSDECPKLAGMIRRVEEEEGHRRTVLVGDLNMNPFEVGVVSANGLNAVMSRTLAERQTRRVQGQDHAFFYNPMWGHFGDAVAGPPGSYFFRSSQPVEYFWNIFDQVLLRPELLSIFKNEELKILSASGEQSLLTAGGRPDRKIASDHLPVLFRLDL